MGIYFSNIWSKGSNDLKTQAQQFLQGCDKSLLEMFNKIQPNFTCDEKLLDIYRKHFQSLQNQKTSPSTLSIIFEFEENRITMSFVPKNLSKLSSLFWTKFLQ